MPLLSYMQDSQLIPTTNRNTKDLVFALIIVVVLFMGLTSFMVGKCLAKSKIITQNKIAETYVQENQGSNFKCLTEGEYTSDEKNCCPGLKLLSASCFNEDGSCSEEICMSGYPACSNCGDGICKGIEDKCNCPSDCTAEQESFQTPPLPTRLPSRLIPETVQPASYSADNNIYTFFLKSIRNILQNFLKIFNKN